MSQAIARAGNASAFPDKMLCGLRVRSGFDLPELLAWTGDDRAADLLIRQGDVPEILGEGASAHPLIQVAPDGQCRFALASVAAYLISADGREVTIAPAQGADATDLRVFLFGTVFAIICQRRGLLPLHACCVQVGDKAVAFAAESGTGKSTLAAGLWRRGFNLLADDVTVVDMSATGGPIVLPSFPRVKLWRDSLESLGHSVDGLESVRPSLDKYQLPVNHGFRATPLRLARLVLLEKKPEAPPGIRTLPAMECMACLGQILYRPRLMLRLGTQARQTDQYLRLIAAVGGLRALRRPETASEWDELEAALRTSLV